MRLDSNQATWCREIISPLPRGSSATRFLSMALSGRPAEAYATLALAEGLAAALPGVRARPEHGLRASRVLYHQPPACALAL